MRELAYFSQNTLSKFENDYNNMLRFNEIIMDAANKISGQYSEKDANKMLRTQFNAILGIDFKNATSMQRRRAWRDHGKEVCALIEDVIIDRMNSGWTQANARFMDLVEEINIANGDKNQFFVNDNSLLQVSKFAGNHHNIIRSAVKPGKAFSIDTSWYVINF